MIWGRRHPGERIAGSRVHPLLLSAPFRSHESPTLISSAKCKAVISYLILVSRNEVRCGGEGIRRRGRIKRPTKKGEWGTDAALALHQLSVLRKNWGRSVEDELWKTEIVTHLQAACFSHTSSCCVNHGFCPLGLGKLAASCPHI